MNALASAPVPHPLPRKEEAVAQVVEEVAEAVATFRALLHSRILKLQYDSFLLHGMEPLI
jgi:hypothetical protein